MLEIGYWYPHPLSQAFAIAILKHNVQRDPQNEKALLRQWLALVELGEAEEADRSLRILECAPMEGTMRGIVEAHKEAIAASEEEIARE